MTYPVGTVERIWRYPVKSTGGEPLREAEVDHRGLVGDRLFAVRDGDGRFGSGKNTRRLPGPGRRRTGPRARGLPLRPASAQRPDHGHPRLGARGRSRCPGRRAALPAESARVYPAGLPSVRRGRVVRIRGADRGRLARGVRALQRAVAGRSQPESFGQTWREVGMGLTFQGPCGTFLRAPPPPQARDDEEHQDEPLETVRRDRLRGSGDHRWVDRRHGPRPHRRSAGRRHDRGRGQHL
ncbi:MOSC N-terminal beta barrel domain-containing protein [Streptomyces sp. NPDC060031]|uniref:MOSC N-terminal beta barrel domain-containing protein n=1 Tax=Streptomyces sp. NPDC060031 TaxID=3347043 RepID=UPI0036D07972